MKSRTATTRRISYRDYETIGIGAVFLSLLVEQQRMEHSTQSTTIVGDSGKCENKNNKAEENAHLSHTIDNEMTKNYGDDTLLLIRPNTATKSDATTTTPLLASMYFKNSKELFLVNDRCQAQQRNQFQNEQIIPSKSHEDLEVQKLEQQLSPSLLKSKISFRSMELVGSLKTVPEDFIVREIMDEQSLLLSTSNTLSSSTTIKKEDDNITNNNYGRTERRGQKRKRPIDQQYIIADINNKNNIDSSIYTDNANFYKVLPIVESEMRYHGKHKDKDEERPSLSVEQMQQQQQKHTAKPHAHLQQTQNESKNNYNNNAIGSTSDLSSAFPATSTSSNVNDVTEWIDELKHILLEQPMVTFTKTTTITTPKSTSPSEPLDVVTTTPIKIIEQLEELHQCALELIHTISSATTNTTTSSSSTTMIRLKFHTATSSGSSSCFPKELDRTKFHQALHRTFPLLKSETIVNSNNNDENNNHYELQIAIDTYFFELIPYLFQPEIDLLSFVRFFKNGYRQQQQQRVTNDSTTTDDNNNNTANNNNVDPNLLNAERSNSKKESRKERRLQYSKKYKKAKIQQKHNDSLPMLRLKPTVTKVDRRHVHQLIDTKTKGQLGTNTIVIDEPSNGTLSHASKGTVDDAAQTSTTTTSIPTASMNLTAITVTWTPIARRKYLQKINNNKNKNNIRSVSAMTFSNGFESYQTKQDDVAAESTIADDNNQTANNCQHNNSNDTTNSNDDLSTNNPTTSAITGIRSNNSYKQYVLCILQKRNKEHLTALRLLSKAIRCRVSDIGLAGIKDKVAITYQFCTIPLLLPSSSTEVPDQQQQHRQLYNTTINMKQQRLLTEGRSFLRHCTNNDMDFINVDGMIVKMPLRKGQLIGNHFEIVVRNVQRINVINCTSTKTVYEALIPLFVDNNYIDIKYVQSSVDRIHKYGFVNYYGEQRVGEPTTATCTSAGAAHDIGRAMLQQDFLKAIYLLLQQPSENNHDNKNNGQQPTNVCTNGDVVGRDRNNSMTHFYPPMNIVFDDDRDDGYRNAHGDGLHTVPNNHKYNRNNNNCQTKHSSMSSSTSSSGCSIRQRLVQKGLKRYGTNNPLAALRCLPYNDRIFFIHAYQAYVWNQMTTERLRRFGMKLIPGDLIIRNRSTCRKKKQTRQQQQQQHNDEEDSSYDNIDMIVINENLQKDMDDEEKEGSFLYNVEILSSEECQKWNHYYDDCNNNCTSTGLVKDEETKDIVSIYNVVLPLPGYDVLYPQNEIGTLYQAIVTKQDGITLQKSSTTTTIPKEGTTKGSYRYIVARVLKNTTIQWNCIHNNSNTTTEPPPPPTAAAITVPNTDDHKERMQSFHDTNDIKFQFQLPKGCYATMLLRELFMTTVVRDIVNDDDENNNNTKSNLLETKAR